MAEVSNDLLVRLFQKQLEIQTLAYGKNPLEITDPEERIEFIRNMHTAMTMEAGELLDECGWKPWATSKHVNEEGGAGEAADVMLFFINLCFAYRITPQKLYDTTMAKMDKNLQRQLDGYDGLKGKCKRCKRALDDTAVECHERIDEEYPEYLGWCGEIVQGPYGPNHYGFFKKAAK